jgi:Cdc6-like AAA superfamily ATPase
MLTDGIDVRERLTMLDDQYRDFEKERNELQARIDLLNPEDDDDTAHESQMRSLINRLRVRALCPPIEFSFKKVKSAGIKQLRKHFYDQYLHLTKEERLRWLNYHTLFFVTPQLREATDKLLMILSNDTIGGTINFRISGPQGAGKTMLLLWIQAKNLPVKDKERNLVPVFGIETPGHDQPVRAMYTRLILECGAVYVNNRSTEKLHRKLRTLASQCRLKLIIMDEVDPLKDSSLKSTLLDISNSLSNIPILAASVNSNDWLVGNDAFEGRWRHGYAFTRYNRRELSNLLLCIELLMPFTKPSNLWVRSLKDRRGKKRKIDGIARFLHRWTDGEMRELMRILRFAGMQAIERGNANISLDLLKQFSDK